MNLVKLESLLRGRLGTNQQIKDLTAKGLTAVGDNYGSTMLTLTLVFEDKISGQDDALELVAKIFAIEYRLLRDVLSGRDFCEGVFHLYGCGANIERIPRPQRYPRGSVAVMFRRVLGNTKVPGPEQLARFRCSYSAVEPKLPWLQSRRSEQRVRLGTL